MQSLLQEFREIVEKAAVTFRALPAAEAERRPVEGKWSRKEILGHLIDSAANNHQRFVRAQLSATTSLPGYEQGGWVASQNYQGESWEEIVQLWQSYNLHLQHIIRHIPESCLQNRITIGTSESVTLEFLIYDYLKHLKHHLGRMAGS